VYINKENRRKYSGISSTFYKVRNGILERLNYLPAFHGLVTKVLANSSPQHPDLKFTPFTKLCLQTKSVVRFKKNKFMLTECVR
jgi:hypothetical protein